MNTEEHDLAIPIREISRLTGVNTVTLRAWERRYGLLKPTRTAKGHRLYSTDDIQRVKDIQAWLVRGLAVSKIKGILESDTSQTANAPFDSVWVEYATRLEVDLALLNRKGLENLLNDLVALYPVELIADQLLAGVVEQLQRQQDYSTKTRLAFLTSVLKEQFYFGQHRQRQTARGKRLLVLKLSADDNDIFPLILNYSLLVNNFQSEFIGVVPTTEIVFAVEQLKADGLIVYSDNATNAVVLQQLIEWLKTLKLPVFLAGKITHIYAAHLSLNADHVVATESLQAVLQAVTQAEEL